MIIYEILKFRVSLSIVERSKVRYIYIVIKLYKSIPYFFIKIIKVLLKLNGFINFILLRTTSMVNSVKKENFFEITKIALDCLNHVQTLQYHYYQTVNSNHSLLYLYYQLYCYLHIGLELFFLKNGTHS